MDDYQRYRICVIKGTDGVGVGVERFIKKGDPLFTVVTAENNTNVTWFGSYYLEGNDVSLMDGYRYAIGQIDKLEPAGVPLLIGLPHSFNRSKSRQKLAKQAIGRLVRFRSVPTQHRKTEETLAMDALKRKSDITEVIYGEH